MNSTTSVGVQRSTNLQNKTEDAATTTDPVYTVTTCSQTPVRTSEATSTQTVTTSCTTTSTAPKQLSISYQPVLPIQRLSKTKNKKKSKQIPQGKRADATTSYDPPPDTSCHCCLCYEILDDTTPAVSHLLTCYELPKHAANLRNLSSATLKHLKCNPSSTIDNLYYHPGIDPPPPDDEDLTDIHHPFDQLDLYPEDQESIDDNLSNYDDDKF